MNDDPSKMDMNGLKSYIANKETEMKNVLMQKIKSMDEELSNKTLEIKQLQANYSKVKEAYEENLILLEERDSDLTQYESKFDSIDKVLQLKDAEIAKGQRELKDLSAIIKDEKAKRTQLEEYNKFNLSKAQSAHKSELKALSDINDEFKNQIESLKGEIVSVTVQSSQSLIQAKEEIASLTKTISLIQKDNEEKDNDINKHKSTIEEMKSSIAKTAQENTKLLKDKKALGETIKQFEIKESDSASSIYLFNQKNKYIQTELDHVKNDLDSKMNKIDIYISQIDQLKNDMFNQKQTIQEKEYEIEKEKFNSKLLNDKVNDLTNTIDKIIKDKSSIDNVLAASAKTYHEQIDKLTSENNDLKKNIVQLNNKIQELANVNVTLKESKDKVPFTQMDDSVVEAVDFFNQKDKENQSNDDCSMIRLQLKQKDIEMGRMKEEYNGIVNNMERIIEEYKNREMTNGDETNQYKQIVFNLEAKVNELEVLYDNEKKIIKSELGAKVTKLTKEIKKLKEDKEKLMRMCSQLKIEVNNLQNDLSTKYETIAISNHQAQMMQYDYEAIDNDGVEMVDEKEKEDIKRKTQKIVNRNMNDEDVKEQAKKTINKVINQIHQSNDEEYNGNDYIDYNIKGDNEKISQPLSPIRIDLRNDYDLSNCLQIDKVSPSQAASEKLRLIKRTSKRDIKS